MYWVEPTTWKRVTDNAREIARTYRWRQMCVISCVLSLAICLCVRFLLPGAAGFLTVMKIACIVVGVTMLPLTVFAGALQTGSVVFRRKVLDVSDSFVHYFIPYKQVVRIGFERFEGKSYFAVKGVPRGKDGEVEVHVALTSKYTEPDIETHLVQRGLGHVFAGTRDVSASPIRTKAPEVRFEAQKVVLVGFHFFTMLVVVPPVLFGVMDMHSSFAVVLALAFLTDLCFWGWLLGKGAGRKVDKLAEGISMRRVWALSIPYVLTIVLNPALVFAVLRWAAVSQMIIWTTSAIWQFTWMALVYALGRLFR